MSVPDAVKIDDTIADAERLIREGKAEAARKLLGDLSPRKIPRPLAVSVANLYRRMGLMHLALKLLAPFVRPSPRRPLVATDPEKLEYAASLIRLGVVNEAVRLLDSVDDTKFP